MAGLALGIDDVVRLAAGALIVAVGGFVLAARPASTLHRLFFVLALMDGVSTVLFGLAFASDAPFDRAYYWGTYYYHWLAFLACLGLFGVFFPRPPIRPALAWGLGVGIVLAACLAIATYVLDHDAYWSAPGALAPMGNVVNISFVALVAAVIVRLTWCVLRDGSASHRRQAAYVLGGMTIAYVPFPTTILLQSIATRGAVPFTAGRLDTALSYWAFLLVALAFVGSAALTFRAWRAHGGPELRFVAICNGLVGVITLVVLTNPTLAIAATLRSVALLIYPGLLAFAIVRYEIFDIDAKLRRATTFSLLAAGITAVFIVAESTLEGILQDRVLGGLSTGFVSNSIAAVMAATLAVPVLRAAQRVSAKVIPELSLDELHTRKLEIYQHSLAGAYADGILKEGESRTLTALRQSLGITDAEHQALMARVLTA